MPRRTSYGRGPPEFLAYVTLIAKHPAYQGMPDAILESGGVQWEAPSNRSSGRFKHTHQKRLDWWRRKAIEVGIDPESVRALISRTAKAIHPTKTKPCKNCGRRLDIRYLYPSRTLRDRILRLPYIESSFPLDPLERVTALVARLVERFGDRALGDLPRLFRARGIEPPTSLTLDGWRAWLEN